LPRIYAYLLGGLSLVLVANSIRPSSREPEADSPPPAAQRPEPTAYSLILRPAGVIAIGAVYLVVVTWLGYLVSLAALLAATTFYLGGGSTRRVVLVAVSGALFFWLLFVALLGIQHPAGFWPSLF
jgi:hypothetical protein